MPGEEDLGGLAGKQAQRRYAAQGVAGEKGAERPTERQVGIWRHAEAPAFSAKHEPEPLKGQNRRQPPAHPLNAIDDFGNTRPLHDVCKERETADCADADENTPTKGA